MRIAPEDLRHMNVKELENEAVRIKETLGSLRQKKNSGDIQPDEIRTAKKNLARTLTIRREKILMELVEKYKGTPIRKLPKELRPRLNKAKRQALTKAQLKKMTRRQRMKVNKVPKVIFAYNE